MKPQKKKWVYPHKCRCGAWLFNRQKALGHCTRCGPDNRVTETSKGEEDGG